MKGERALNAFCGGWKTDSPSDVGLASSLLRNRLLSQERMGCQNIFAVLCIEATAQTEGLSRQRRSTSPTLVDAQRPKLSGVRAPNATEDDGAIMTRQDLEELLDSLDQEIHLERNSLQETADNDTQQKHKEETQQIADKKEEKSSWWFW